MNGLGAALLGAVVGGGIGAAATVWAGTQAIESTLEQFRDQHRLSYLREAYDNLSNAMNRRFDDGAVPLTKEEIIQKSASLTQAHRLILLFGSDPERDLLIAMKCRGSSGSFTMEACQRALAKYPNAQPTDYSDMFPLITNSIRRTVALNELSADEANFIIDHRASLSEVENAPTMAEIIGPQGGYVAPIVDVEPVVVDACRVGDQNCHADER